MKLNNEVLKKCYEKADNELAQLAWVRDNVDNGENVNKIHPNQNGNGLEVFY